MNFCQGLRGPLLLVLLCTSTLALAKAVNIPVIASGGAGSPGVVVARISGMGCWIRLTNLTVRQAREMALSI